MSNLPHPPAGPGDNPGSEPNKPEEPRYGQNPPQYGQNPPSYGQDAPKYGQNPPQYGQNPPGYGQQPSAPQYGQNPPQYGEGVPSYGQPPAPQYGQAQPGQAQYGQAPYGQSPYGQPQPGQGGWPSQQPAATSGVPQLVNTAFLMIAAAAVLSAIGSLIFGFTGGDYITAMVQESMRQSPAPQELPPGFAETMNGMLALSGVIGAVINLGLYALVAFPVRKGKNWARILGTVFAALSVFGLFNLFDLGALFGIIQLLSILLGVAAIVLLYLPDSAPYFRKVQPFANPYGQGPYNQGPYGR